MNTLTRLHETWQAMPLRDRRALLLCGAVLLAVSGWFAGWAPASQAVARIERELPGEKTELDRLEALAKTAATLARQPSPTLLDDAALRADAQRSLEAAGIGAAKIEVANGVLRVQVEKASFHAWMQWLADMRKRQAMAVISMEARRQGAVGAASTVGTAGEVSASAELQR